MFAGIMDRFPSKNPWANMDRMPAKVPKIMALLKLEVDFRALNPFVKAATTKNKNAAKPMNPISEAIWR